MESKFCPDCNSNRPICEFGKEVKRKGGLQYCCKKHHVIRNAIWRRNKLYGVSQEVFYLTFKKQLGKCAICNNEMSGSDRNNLPCQDHDHVTKKNRDLLCCACNRLIGDCFENIEILASAIRYLQKHTDDSTNEIVCENGRLDSVIP